MNTLYQCDICKTIYTKPEDAHACEAKGLEQVPFEVGDFVIVQHEQHMEDGQPTYGMFGWFDGNADWVIPCPRGLHSKAAWDGNYYTFIYVVTAITSERRNSHRAEIHVETDAMTSGYRHGRTYTSGHYMLQKWDCDLPKDNIKIGSTFRNLL